MAAKRKTTTRSKKTRAAKAALAQPVEERPVGFVLQCDPTNLAVLNALNDTLVKMKAQAFDQIALFIRQTEEKTAPVDQKYQEVAKKAAKEAGCPVDEDSLEKWVFTLEDGLFTRKE